MFCSRSNALLEGKKMKFTYFLVGIFFGILIGYSINEYKKVQPISKEYWYKLTPTKMKVEKCITTCTEDWDAK